MSKRIVESKGKGVDEREKPLLVDQLKPEWQTFIYAILDGMSQTRAYMKAYPHITDENVAAVNGSKLRHKAKVKAAIDELLDRSAEACYQDLVSLQRKALSVLSLAAEGHKVDPTQLAAAKDILDRTGLIRRAGLNVKAERDWDSTVDLLED